MFDLDTLAAIRHEAIHAAAFYVLLGEDFVGAVTRRRVAGSHGRAQFELANLPQHRHPALVAADLAVCALAPYFDSKLPLSESDLALAHACAVAAYPWRPEHERSLEPTDWEVRWIHGTVQLRAKELLDSARFRKLRSALERQLDSHLDLTAEEVRATFRLAELQVLNTVAPSRPVRSERELRAALAKLES